MKQATRWRLSKPHVIVSVRLNTTRPLVLIVEGEVLIE